ncbi:putative lipoprotein [Bacteriovorax sp. BAL6_X]|uniref:hypothetical protein n=1 Tax=Bacteriovorax sp. BAL6_X TaxID=1201290 RepID=UPI000386A2FB|nr:hypothetical protein [Bacteriovorax sp. BAL6_X]EPZ49928.1 putative lipoprotein [Bacteriovorax sp. BAL6_X]
MKNHLLIFILSLNMSFQACGLNLAGASVYFDKEELSKAMIELSSQEQAMLDDAVLSTFTCEFDALEELYQLIGGKLKEVLIYLRSNSRIDDTQYRLLLRTVRSFEVSKKEKQLSPFNPIVKNFKKKSFVNFQNALQKGVCFNTIAINLFKELGEKRPIKFLKKAYHQNLIDKRTYWMLKRLVQEDYHLEPQTLAEYLKVQNFLTKQFPDRINIQKTDYISGRAEKSKVSRREALLAKYNQFQIIYLRGMTQRLLNRLNADEVIINVIIDDESVEEIILDPMEQYRFAAKMVRKELGDLQMMNLFEGIDVGFEDILAAAFETGLVSGEDLSTLALVDDVWNPELTKAEKRKRFIRRYGTIFVAAIPTTFYLVKVLSLVGIEMLTETKQEPPRDHSIF